ncbi:MAG TPA: hypothetical protein VD993_19760 [Chitinophagaceae bacterium]|nr:hypothetical protein [Chitinophagaceae bacterium]
MKQLIAFCCTFSILMNIVFAQNAPPPQANVQYQPYILNQLNKDVVVSDINMHGDVTGWIEDEGVTPTAFIYKNSGPISQRWVFFEKGDMRIHTKGFGITNDQTVIGSRKTTNKGLQGMRWWQSTSNQLGYNTAVLEIAPGNANLRDYEILGALNIGNTPNYAYVGNATVERQFPTGFNNKVETKLVRQAFIKRPAGYTWLPTPFVPEEGNLENAAAGGNKFLYSYFAGGRSGLYNYIVGSAEHDGNKRWAVYWQFQKTNYDDLMDAGSWKPFVIKTNNDAHLNAVAMFGNAVRPMAVGYYMSAGSNAWMFDLSESTNYRMNELTPNATSEAFDCTYIGADRKLPYDFLVVGKCGNSAVKWEFNSSANIRSHKVVDLFTVMNQRLYDGLTLSTAVAVNNKGQILCLGQYKGRKVGVILTPKE